MHKEMESSVFFSIFQLMQFRNIIFTEMLGRTVTETARTKSWDYSTVYDSRTSQDGRKRLCKP